MKLIIEKESCERLYKSSFEENLLDVCRWINFVEDNMNVWLPSDRIFVKIEFDQLSISPYVYMKNGAYEIYHRLPVKSSWDCYCALDGKHFPLAFIYINKESDAFNGFILGAMFLRGTQTIEIDTRKYKC